MLCLLQCFLTVPGITGSESRVRRLTENAGFQTRCTHKVFSLPEELFRIHACTFCYSGLILKHNIYHPKPSKYGYWTLKQNESSINPRFPVEIAPDPYNETVLETICDSMESQTLCDNWLECCQAGMDCCKKQLSEPLSPQGTHCPRTWDGYQCWDDTLPGTHRVACPTFLEFGINRKYIHYVCSQDIIPSKAHPDYDPDHHSH